MYVNSKQRYVNQSNRLSKAGSVNLNESLKGWVDAIIPTFKVHEGRLHSGESKVA